MNDDDDESFGRIGCVFWVLLEILVSICYSWCICYLGLCWEYKMHCIISMIS